MDGKIYNLPRLPTSNSRFHDLLACCRCEETEVYRVFEHDLRTASFLTKIKAIQVTEAPCSILS